MTDYRYKLPDVAIIARGGSVIHFYKDVLVEHSDYFKTLFTRETSETEGIEGKKDNETILDSEYDDIILLLNLIHPVKSSELRYQDVYQIIDVAHKYKFDKIRDKSMSFLDKYYLEEKADLKTLKEHSKVINQCILKYAIAGDKHLSGLFKNILGSLSSKILNTTSEDATDDETLKGLPEDMANHLLRIIFNDRNRIIKHGKELQVYYDKYTKLLNGIETFKAKIYAASSNAKCSTSLLNDFKKICDENGMVW